MRTSDFLRLIEEKKMCKFWFYIVAKLDEQDYHPLWKKKFKFWFKIVAKLDVQDDVTWGFLRPKENNKT